MKRESKAHSHGELDGIARSGLLVSTACLWAGRVAALALLAYSPWNYGMVHWESQVPLLPWCAVVLGLAIVALPAANVRLGQLLFSPITLGLLGLILAAGLQTVVLPDTLWQRLAAGSQWESQTGERADAIAGSLGEPLPPLVDLKLDNAGGDGELRFPRTLSVHPLQTRASLGVFAAAIAFYLGCGIVLSRQLGSLLMLATLSVSSVVVGGLGLMQSLTARTWIPESILLGKFATFVSPNSAPQFLAIGFASLLGLLSWWIAKRRQTDTSRHYGMQYASVNPIARLRRRVDEAVADIDVPTALLGLGLAIAFVAVMATASRGGIVGFGCALLLAAVATLTRGGPGKTTSSAGGSGLGGILLVLVILAVGATAMTWLDLDGRTLRELSSIDRELYERDNVRLDLWQWTMQEPATWLLGAGLGTYHFAILPSYGVIEDTWYYHAESIYIETLAEFGLPGMVSIGLILGGLGWSILIRGERAKRNELLFPAGTFAAGAVAVQSTADFSLVIPAIFLPLAAVLGAFCAAGNQSQFVKRKKVDAKERARRAVTKGSRPTSSQGRKGSRSTTGSGEAVDATTALASKNAGGGKGQGSRGRSRQADTSPPPYAQIGMLVAMVGMVLLAMWQGFESLQGFAAGERLEREMKIVRRQATELSTLRELDDRYRQHPMRHHPELAVQMARLRQNILSLAIAGSDWQVEMDEQAKKLLSSPELLAAAVRGGAAGPLAGIQPVLETHRVELEQLMQTHAVFERVARQSPIDWRAYWGMLRSQAGQSPVLQQATALARLELSGRHHANMLESAGLASIWSGDIVVGRELCRLSLSAGPRRAIRLAAFAPLLSIEDLESIVQEPLARAKLAEQMSKGDQEVQAMARKLVDNILLVELEQVATSESDWTTTAFIAEEREEFEAAIRAMERAVSKSPFKWQLRYQLAKLHEQQGEWEQALNVMNEMRNVTRENVTYSKFVAKLKAKLELQTAEEEPGN